MRKGPIIFTVGHSTRDIEDFVEVLKAYQVEEVVDVRTIPRSRHNPQFSAEVLPESLRKAGIGYLHLKGLGGLRHPLKDSLNAGWHNLSFQGFADYMQTEEFQKNIERLTALSRHKRLAVMCAEALPWRCHRSLIADALSVRGIEVVHITNRPSSCNHILTPFAKVHGKHITYPPGV